MAAEKKSGADKALDKMGVSTVETPQAPTGEDVPFVTKAEAAPDNVDMATIRAQMRAEIMAEMKKDLLPGLIAEIKAEAMAIARAEAAEDYAEEVAELKQAEAVVKAQPKYRLVIYQQEGPEGKEPVFVGVNGYGYMIRRGEEVIVPRGVVSVLEEAVEIQVTKNDKTGDDVETPIKRFSFHAVPID